MTALLSKSLPVIHWMYLQRFRSAYLQAAGLLPERNGEPVCQEGILKKSDSVRTMPGLSARRLCIAG